MSESARVWFGPVGDEWIGEDSDGTPVVANEDGVARMIDVSAYFDPASITFTLHDEPTL